ncbi:MAG: hypothetical protein EZS28_016577 [Streblomastix strix]|uniref:Uncharacterized protein n=1 Tax=Streblomastix strix TaxID=222440 RepID=A0A5J4VZA7_9EUKA|nr:MAG: hypothetical protein EZS28_016577 [Streblomastix strix]
MSREIEDDETELPVRDCFELEDKESDRFPFSVVWTKIPLLTWVLPFIGHLGICDSKGKVYDFQGPYSIGVDSMAFARPVKIWRFFRANSRTFATDGFDKSDQVADSLDIAKRWDDSIIAGSRAYSRQMHKLITNNCHHHVAECLNKFYEGHGAKKFTVLNLASGMITDGIYVKKSAIFGVYLPLVIIVLIIIGIVLLITD